MLLQAKSKNMYYNLHGGSLANDMKVEFEGKEHLDFSSLPSCMICRLLPLLYCELHITN